MANAPTPTGPARAQPISRKTQPRSGRPAPTPAPSAPTSSDPTFLYTPYSAGLPNWDWDLVKGIPAAQYNNGYDSTATALGAKRRVAALNAANAIISDGDYQMRIIVTDANIDTSLSGSTAQSAMTRDFYAHNFVQPSYQVSGVSLDQKDYALLCEFIHSAQRKAVLNGYRNLTQLWVFGRDPSTPSRSRGIDGTRTNGRQVILSNPGSLMPGRRKDPATSRVPDGAYISQSIRGAHQPILAKGYVDGMPREHQAFQYAVPWQLNFVVAAVLKGIYTDPPVRTAASMPTWQQMLSDAQSSGVVEPNAKANKAALHYAKQHSATLF